MPTDNARLAALVSRVSRANLERDVNHLANAYPTRHTLGKYLPDVAEWLRKRLHENGVPGARLHTYSQFGRTLPNVVAEKPGIETPGSKTQTILLCAHFDSRAENLMDATVRAPGADDNATGVAAVLEAVRVLTAHRLADHLRIVFFSGEEQGQWGSQAYAQAVKAEKLNLRFVFNVDQIGLPPADRALFVDRDEAAPVQNNAASAALVERVRTLAREVVKVPTRTDPAEHTDYVAFEQLGYVITGLYEAVPHNPNYHRTTDTPDKVDFAYVHDMTRLTVATLASEGGLR